MAKSIYFITTALMLALTGCGHSLSKGRDFQLTKVSYAQLKGWQNDNIREVMPALMRSCQKPSLEWKNFCTGLQKYKFSSPAKVRAYIEKTLQPYAVTSNGSRTGTITGYYEAELTGTRTKTKPGQVPVYGAPSGYKNGQVLQTRKEIEQTPHYSRIIAWADDPVELFILQVQGSGRMETPEGEIKLAYAGNNGHTFKGLGQIMKEAGVLKPGQGSMPAMKKWLQEHPAQAEELMAQNPRYIFFKEIQGESPYGSAGVVLTPGRSVAVDTKFIPPHTPMWLETKDPDGIALNKMVVAQDVGSAITGSIRADYFWGHGARAFDKAGRMNSAGKYYLFLPK